METSAQPRIVSRVSGGRQTLSLAAPDAPGRGTWWTRPSLWSGQDNARIRAFTRQVATLLLAGFTLDRALSIIGALLGDDRLGMVIRDVQERVRQGQRLASALAGHPRYFGELYRGVIAAGERSGQLAEAFQRLADHLDRQAELRSRLLGALLYPAIMVVAGSAAVLLLLLFVIPRFAVILGDVGGTLPWTASTLLWVGDIVSRGWWLAALGAVAGIAAVTLHRHTPIGRVVQDLWLVRLPIVGSLRARVATERVARTLAGALAGGIPLLEALDIVSDAAGDAAFRRELMLAAESVRRGEALSATLRRGRVVPELAIQMIAAGEESGRVVPLLEHVASAYRTETEQQLRSLVAVVEPVIIVLFGSLVAFVALALLQTIYGIGTTL